MMPVQPKQGKRRLLPKSNRKVFRFLGSAATGAAILVLAVAQGAKAQVVADGTTSTTVTVGADGAVTVGIAPVTRNGVSLNRFDEFNVAEEGLSLDNRAEAARTIVNEVTGRNESTLRGDVDVLGQRAHVIIANPNGIVVDGTRFFNTGRVALTTGEIGTTDRLIAPFVTQMNVTSTVTGGVVRIEGGGLAGQMDAVDIIAHQIMVNGEIRNDSDSPNAGIRLIGGQSRTEFESAIVPGNTDLNWGTVRPTTSAASDAILIEILRPGALRANRIGIQVTEAGAGVRLAGNALATSREFSLSSTGKVIVVDAAIEGTGGVFLAGSDVQVENSTIDGVNSTAIIDAGAQGLSLATSRLTAAEVIVRSVGPAAFSNSVVDANAGNLTITSGAGLRFSETSLEAANSTFLTAADGTNVSGSSITARGNTVIETGSLVVENANDRSRVVAENGSLLIQTHEGDLVNDGGLLQGAIEIAGVATQDGTSAQGAVTLNVAGSLRNRSGAELAVIFGLADSVSIRTGADVENRAGRIVAGDDLKIVAVGNVLNLAALPTGTITSDVVTHTRRGKRLWWTFWLRRERIAETSYDYGAQLSDSAVPSMSAAGSVTISADEVINQGGTISAATGDLHLRAVRVETIGVGYGRVKVTQVCALRCTSASEGFAGVQSSGLFADGDIGITASEQVSNVGSVLQAGQNVTIDSPDVTVAALAAPMPIQRPGGLHNLFSGAQVWLYMRDYFGVVIAGTGALTLNSTAAIRIVGGALEGQSVVTPTGQTIVRPPSDLATPGQQMIGWFQSLPLVRN
jgi:filamentous hemagglutinin family protein